MDYEKTGLLIKALRGERGWTQKELAAKLSVSDKTVSRWERGLGCPDTALLSPLSEALGVDLKNMLQGDLAPKDPVPGNLKKAVFYVCPLCHNVMLLLSPATIFCCGRKLEPLQARKAADGEKLTAEPVEDEWYISSDHPMTKEDYISFLAFCTGDRVTFVKKYPQWDLFARIPRREHGFLYYYSDKLGLLYQYL